MQNSAVVRCGERASYLPYDVCGTPEICSLGSDNPPEAEAIHILHDNERLPIRQLTDVKYADDAGMIDSRQGLNFLLELSHSPFVFYFALVQDFDHHWARKHLFVRG